MAIPAQIRQLRVNLEKLLEQEVEPSCLELLPFIDRQPLSFNDAISETRQRLREGINFTKVPEYIDSDPANYWKKPEQTPVTMGDVLYSLLRLDSAYIAFGNQAVFHEGFEDSDNREGPLHCNSKLIQLLDEARKHKAIAIPQLGLDQTFTEMLKEIFTGRVSAAHSDPEIAALLEMSDDVNYGISATPETAYSHGFFEFLLQLTDFINCLHTCPLPEVDLVRDAFKFIMIMRFNLEEKIDELQDQSLENFLVEYQGLFSKKEYYQSDDLASPFFNLCLNLMMAHTDLRLAKLNDPQDPQGIAAAEVGFETAMENAITTIQETCHSILTDDERGWLKEILNNMLETNNHRQAEEVIQNFCERSVATHVAINADEIQGHKDDAITQLKKAQAVIENLGSAISDIKKVIEVNQSRREERDDR